MTYTNASYPRLRLNNLFSIGSPPANPITLASSTATTATWTSNPGFPTIAFPAYAAVIVEPGTSNEEIIWITAYTAAATSATVVRAKEGTTAATHSAVSWVHGQTAADFDPGAPLASVIYNPTSETSYSALTSSTYAALDPTNLTISFVVPASGNVRISFEAYAYTDGTSIPGAALGVHGGSVVASTESALFNAVGGNSYSRIHYEGHLVGISAGTSVQYDIFVANVANAGNANFYAGGTSPHIGPAVIQAFAE